MATGWNAQIGGGKYALQFETDRKDLFKTVEAACYNVMNRVEYERLKKEKSNAPEWVCAAKIKPEEGELVLLIATGEVPNGMLVNAYELGYWWGEDGWELERFPDFDTSDIKVSAWMKLPDPPAIDRID